MFSAPASPSPNSQKSLTTSDEHGVHVDSAAYLSELSPAAIPLLASPALSVLSASLNIPPTNALGEIFTITAFDAETKDIHDRSAVSEPIYVHRDTCPVQESSFTSVFTQTTNQSTSYVAQTRSSAPSPSPPPSAISPTRPLAPKTPPPAPQDNHHAAATVITTPPTIASFNGRTPNVYINGLPPRLPEAQLLLLARTYGAVKSVRTFTRTSVTGEPSGYGFVLYQTIEEAERCIESLKRTTTLVPSFSKQSRRLPNLALVPTMPDENGTETFRERMERLCDNTSTNLYFEGLPLSIDEPTLTALVSPHRIRSSRLFQTKLSDPPRIIAFVRFETRAAAEEIIERLHGRMIRGLNDPGCRVSVRFADSMHQRELRRCARTGRSDEEGSQCLTIAEATLLNLHGSGMQGQPPRSHALRGLHSSNFDVPIQLTPVRFITPAQYPPYGPGFDTICSNEKPTHSTLTINNHYQGSCVEEQIMRNYKPRCVQYANSHSSPTVVQSLVGVPGTAPTTNYHRHTPFKSLPSVSEEDPNSSRNIQHQLQNLHLSPTFPTKQRPSQCRSPNNIRSSPARYAKLNTWPTASPVRAAHDGRGPPRNNNQNRSSLYRSQNPNLFQHQILQQQYSQSIPVHISRTRSVTAPAQPFWNQQQNTAANRTQHSPSSIRHGMPNPIENGLAKSMSSFNYAMYQQSHAPGAQRTSPQFIIPQALQPTFSHTSSSSPQTSPTLTWASHTPSTLSPSTPFFNAFTQLPETAESLGYGKK